MSKQYFNQFFEFETTYQIVKFYRDRTHWLWRFFKRSPLSDAKRIAYKELGLEPESIAEYESMLKQRIVHKTIGH